MLAAGVQSEGEHRWMLDETRFRIQCLFGALIRQAFRIARQVGS